MRYALFLLMATAAAGCDFGDGVSCTGGGVEQDGVCQCPASTFRYDGQCIAKSPASTDQDSGAGDDAGARDAGADARSTFDADTPFATPASKERQLAAGEGHTCAITRSGGVRCWGLNVAGQLGDGTSVGRSTPKPVEGLTDIVELTAGDSHTCALTKNGTVKCWGRNAEGQAVGNTALMQVAHSPTMIEGLTDVTRIVAGAVHNCALLKSGGVTCWGGNSQGQLGDGKKSPTGGLTVVSDLTNAVALAAGSSHTCALLVDGSVKCWGLGTSGQLGGGSTATGPGLVTVQGIVGAAEITAGGNHTCARDAEGLVTCWGWGLPAPLPVDITRAAGLSSGNPCALIADGTVECWGPDYRNSMVKLSMAVQVYALMNVVQIVGGGRHHCALLMDGIVMCWGENGTGQLGVQTPIASETPVPVEWP